MRMLRFVVAAAFVVMAAAGASAQTDDLTLSPAQVAVACSPPPTLDGAPAHALRVIGAQDTVPRTLYGNGDVLVINGGMNAGVQLGQRFFVRRANRYAMTGEGHGHGAKTLGWLRVVAVNESTAIAAIDHVCGAVLKMDYLEPFAVPVVPTMADRDGPRGEVDFTSLARIVVGADDRDSIAPGDFALIDRGSEQGVTAGARFGVYRDLREPGLPLASVGEAVVVSIGPSMALAQITRARDAVISGDYVAFRR